MRTFHEALDAADPRPDEDAAQGLKKNYAERLSRHVATLVAGSLRPWFDGITPDAEGRGQESPARTSKGFKKLDINYSKAELGLALGVSVKTINFRTANRYTRNYTRVDNELRAEAIDYHRRQPWSVLVALLFLPLDAAQDWTRGEHPTSFGQAIRVFRHRANRRDPKNDVELFERMFVGLYEHTGPTRGNVVFFDVMDDPPRKGPPDPSRTFVYDAMIAEIVRTYDERNNPAFRWSDD